MRSEKEMLDLITGVAARDARIRAVYLNGSRANPSAPKDIFQDYDIVYLVGETASFLSDPKWIDVFGERVILQLPDELDKIAGETIHFERSYAYLMQFADGNRIDLTLLTRKAALEQYGDDSLTIPLLDKDGVLPQIPPPSDRNYLTERPTQPLFSRCCNNFWWVSLYIAKGLWRGELLYAMDSLNFWVRPELVKMLSWYAGAETGFPIRAGKSGKYLPAFLPKELFSRFLSTYPAGEAAAVWKSVHALCDLFDLAARDVAEKLALVYDGEEARRCLGYLRHIEGLPKDAAAIF